MLEAIVIVDKKNKNKSQIEDVIRGQIRRRVHAATDIKPVTFLHTFYME